MWFRKKQERQRFYLLPGMGGSARRRKKAMILKWSLATGLFTSLLVAWLLRWISNR
jgi:hypothetical protein